MNYLVIIVFRETFKQRLGCVEQLDGETGIQLNQKIEVKDQRSPLTV